MYILLDAGAQGGGAGSMLIWMIIFFVLIWFLMMRPQQKKNKEERKFRESLKHGDRVICAGGIYGKVDEVEDKTVKVEVSGGVIITVEKTMIVPAPENNAK